MGWEGRGRWGRCRAGRETTEEGGERPAELSAPRQGGVGVPLPAGVRLPRASSSGASQAPRPGLLAPSSQPLLLLQELRHQLWGVPLPPTPSLCVELPGDDGTRLASRCLSCSSLLGPTSSLVQLP